MRRLVVVLFPIGSLAAAALGCSRPEPALGAAASSAADSLALLLSQRLGVAPVSLEFRPGERILVSYADRAWTASADRTRYDRARDVAGVLWERYGAAHDIDTISVRIDRIIEIPEDTAYSEEFYFYAAQLARR